MRGESRGTLETLDDLLEHLLRRTWAHRRVVAVALAVLVGAWTLRPGGGEAPPLLPGDEVVTTEAEVLNKQLAGRAWIDHLPEDKRDKIRLYFFAPEKDIGVHLTLHSHTWWVQEIFQYKAGKGQIGFRFFDPKVQMKTKVKLKKVQGKEHVDMVMNMTADPQAKGANFRYLRLKKDHLKALGLPDVATLEGMLSAATK